MIKIIVCVIVAIASLFALTPSVDVVCASSQPITNSVNFNGTPNFGNPFELSQNAYFSSYGNWSYTVGLNHCPYVFQGVEFRNVTGYTMSNRQYSLVMWFNVDYTSAMPNLYEYYIYIQTELYVNSIANTSSNVQSKFRSRSNGTISMYDTTLFELQYDYNGNPITLSNNEYNENYVLCAFRLPYNDIYQFELNFMLASDPNSVNSNIVPIYGIYYGMSLTIDDAYNSGYTDGKYYESTIVNPNSASYNAGYNAGVTDANNTVNVDSASYTNGYSQGYNAAQNSSDTFYNMVVSVLDAPVQVFLDTFDFEIFGVNVSSIILSLFTLAVITFIIKLLI